MERRAFLTALATGWAVDTVVPSQKPMGGRIIGASHTVGHLLRDGAANKTNNAADIADVVIVGSGIAGLSAA